MVPIFDICMVADMYMSLESDADALSELSQV